MLCACVKDKHETQVKDTDVDTGSKLDAGARLQGPAFFLGHTRFATSSGCGNLACMHVDANNLARKKRHGEEHIVQSKYSA